MNADGSPTLREWADMKIQHERELREANERSVAIALQLSQAQARAQTALILGLAGAAVGLITVITR